MTFDPEISAAIAECRPDDVIEVVGALRRRFYKIREGAGRGNNCEVEALSVRLLERRVTVSFRDAVPSPSVPVIPPQRPSRSPMAAIPPGDPPTGEPRSMRLSPPKECSACGHVDTKGRPDQESSLCRSCGVAEHTDVSGVRTIASRRETDWAASYAA
ncbi:hypothetical protein [Streptosporangium soli]